jgi:uncharacterized protein (DUF3820 family)
MTITKQTIVRFGKYKGKKFSDLLRDESYCRWLIKGEWLNQETKSFLEEFYPCENDGECQGGRVYLTDGEYRPCENCRPLEYKKHWYSGNQIISS